jgi:hypothetical protein
MAMTENQRRWSIMLAAAIVGGVIALFFQWWLGQ